MESLGNPPFLLMDGDDIFNFPLDGEDGIDPGRRFSELEFAEEELEWLSNKDAFPAVETGLDIFTPHQNLQSPISVLENSSSSSNSNGSGTMSCCGALPVPISFPVHYPVRARSKRRRRRRREFPELPVAVQQAGWWNQVNVRNVKQDFLKALPITGGSSIGRRCQHCQAEKTPQWRAGPMGPKTLCNACGVRYKSGRLVPEYRPANSPTFSSQVHSNSHRKIMEMRRHTLGDNMMVK